MALDLDLPLIHSSLVHLLLPLAFPIVYNAMVHTSVASVTYRSFRLLFLWQVGASSFILLLVTPIAALFFFCCCSLLRLPRIRVPFSLPSSSSSSSTIPFLVCFFLCSLLLPDSSHVLMIVSRSGEAFYLFSEEIR